MAPRNAKPETSDVCKKCGQVHTGCLAHKTKRDDEGKLIPCGQRPMKTSRTQKCHMHGGKTPKGKASPQYKHGKKSKSLSKIDFLPDPALAERTHALAMDVIRNLEDSIKINAMIESCDIEKLGSTESRKAWSVLSGLVIDYREAKKPETQSRIFDKIEQIVKNGAGEGALIRDIRVSQEAQRRLTETAVKARKDRSETLTVENFQWLLAKMLFLIKNHVTDRPTYIGLYSAIQQEYESIPDDA